MCLNIHYATGVAFTVSFMAIALMCFSEYVLILKSGWVQSCSIPIAYRQWRTEEGIMGG